MLVPHSRYQPSGPLQTRRLIFAGLACTALMVGAFFSGAAYGASGHNVELESEAGGSEMALRGKGKAANQLQIIRERLDAAEANINAEIARAIAAEATNAADINAEEIRAIAKENLNEADINTNANSINAEELRALAAEATNAADIDTEEARAVAKEDLNEAGINTNAGNINAEQLRALAAEATNAADIDTEEARAKAAEATNAAAIEAEEARALAAEAAEAARAGAAEATNAAAIAAEEARALAAEALISSDIHHLGGAYACRPGYFRAEDDECKGCSAGTYLPETGTSASDCLPCAENFFSEVGFVECDPCQEPTPFSHDGITCVAGPTPASAAVAWGAQGPWKGQLGVGSDSTVSPSNVGVVAGPADLVQIATMQTHSIFVHSDGTASSAGGLDSPGPGGNPVSLLGNTPDPFTGTFYNVPTKIIGLTGVVMAGVSDSFSMFVLGDGSVKSLGRNNVGQLGIGSTTTYEATLQDVLISDVKHVASGGYSFTMLLKNDNSVWGVGANGNGQLGSGDFNNKATPVQATTQVAQVDVGSSHSIILTQDGSVQTAGRGANGQLGLGSGNTGNYATFQLVLNGPDQTAGQEVVQVSAGFAQSMYLRADGAVFGCGHGNSGRLGTADHSEIYVFTSLVPAVTTSPVVKVVTGGTGAIFLHANGRVDHVSTSVGSTPTEPNLPDFSAVTVRDITTGLYGYAILYTTN